MKSLRDEILRGKMKSTIVEYKEREAERKGKATLFFVLFCKYMFAYKEKEGSK